MIAAILDFQEGAGLAVKVIHHLRRVFAQAHNVVDADFRGHAKIGTGEFGISCGDELFPVAEHRIHFRHGGIALGLDLGGTAGDDDEKARGAKVRTGLDD